VRYRGVLFRGFLALFTVSFLTLMYLGLKPATGLYVTAARVAAVGYFSFFLLMPWYSRMDRTKPVPERVRFHA
jgi:ubiquinol-cytochrome c reductase cytochrome b subunit